MVGKKVILESSTENERPKETDRGEDGDAKKAAASAISSGSPKLPRGLPVNFSANKIFQFCSDFFLFVRGICICTIIFSCQVQYYYKEAFTILKARVVCVLEKTTIDI